jgi:II/X family phage/plasmid replication protein
MRYKKLIDTIKIYTMISKNIYNIIKNNSIVKTSYQTKTGEVFYNIVNDKLEGSYSSSLSVRVGEGVRYKFINQYYLEIEGSFHKIVRGYNSHNGFYNIISITQKLIDMLEQHYNIKLPNFKHWFLNRVDITKVFDLNTNDNVRDYINNLSFCRYPRRKIKHYNDESIYMSGTTTTLKIYNKMLEFRKHDMKKLNDGSFPVLEFLSVIQGFVRFECEIKKKKLEQVYNKKYIRIKEMNYKDFEKIWSDEFMKMIRLFEKDLEVVRKKQDVEKRLKTLYKENSAMRLYNFYLSIMVDGLENVKKRTSRPTFYRNISLLKDANVDFSQSTNINFDEHFIDFDPFSYPEVV